MSEPVLIAVILQELGCFDGRNEKGKKGEVDDEVIRKNSSINSGKERKYIKSIVKTKQDSVDYN